MSATAVSRPAVGFARSPAEAVVAVWPLLVVWVAKCATADWGRILRATSS